MTRTFVSDIKPQSQVDEVFRIADRQLRANRQGNMYLLLQLQDRTGVISGMRWNADERLAERFNKGSFVRVQGASQLHNGVVQLIVNQMQTVPEEEIRHEDFDQVCRVDLNALWTEAMSCIASTQHPTIRAILESFASDPAIAEGLKLAPAGVKTHHAYPGGLLEHVVSLMKLAGLVAKHYPHVDHDLLIAGAFLHDIGKLEELNFQDELTYSDAGQLLGHLIQGVQMLDRQVNQLVASGVVIDREIVLRLQHIIVSHHGYLEHGSPKVPMTLEALAFHYLDELDAKLNAATTLVAADKTSDPWTTFNPALGRKILKKSVAE